MAAPLLLEELFPEGALQNISQRSTWIKRMQSVKPVIESWLALSFAGNIRSALHDDVK